MYKAMNLISSFITLAILYYIYTYAKNLDDCKCTSFLKPKIDNIKNIEFIFICMSVVTIVINILVNILGFNFKNVTLIKNTGMLKAIYVVLSLILYIILINFIYNVYEFGTQLPPDCNCADKWQKDILFIQAGLYSIITIFATIMLSSSIYHIRSVKK